MAQKLAQLGIRRKNQRMNTGADMNNILKNCVTPLSRVIPTALAIALVGSVAAAEMTLSADPETVPLTREGTVTINGTGFEPGSEIFMLLATNDGLESDVAEYLEPPLTVRSDGTVSTTLSYGAFVRRKLLDKNTYAVSVTDGGYNILASTDVNFE